MRREIHLRSDIADRPTRVAAQTESLRAQLDTAFAHYQTLVANSQNELLKVLTICRRPCCRSPSSRASTA